MLYWPGAKSSQGAQSHTATAAELLQGHTPVVWVANHATCIALTHIAVIAEKRGRKAQETEAEG